MDEFELNPIGDQTDGGEQDSEDLQEDIQDEKGSDDSGAGEGADDEPAGDAARQEAERARKFNASMKAARLDGEKAAEERLSKAHAQRIADIRMPNPEKPGEYFTTIEEMEAYSKSYRRSQAEARAKREQRSVEEILEEDENRAYLAKKRKEEAAKAHSEPDTGATMRAHVAEMRERYPDVDILKLEQNQSFIRFCGSRYGKESLADLYEAYIELMGGAEKAAAAKAQSKAQRSTDSRRGNWQSQCDTYHHGHQNSHPERLQNRRPLYKFANCGSGLTNGSRHQRRNTYARQNGHNGCHQNVDLRFFRHQFAALCRHDGHEINRQRATCAAHRIGGKAHGDQGKQHHPRRIQCHTDGHSDAGTHHSGCQATDGIAQGVISLLEGHDHIVQEANAHLPQGIEDGAHQQCAE